MRRSQLRLVGWTPLGLYAPKVKMSSNSLNLTALWPNLSQYRRLEPYFIVEVIWMRGLPLLPTQTYGDKDKFGLY